MGIVSLMYHRFNENQYPSTNIKIDIFKKQIEQINNKKINFMLPSNFDKNFNLKKSIHESTYELWNFCKKELLSGENDQIILDEIFLAIEMKIIDKDDLISTLENRFISGDVILTGTDIPKDLLLMANQITELRS